MKRAALLIAVAFAVSGCTYGNWGHIGIGGDVPRPPVEREMRIESPRLSPDGKAIIFAFRYKQYPWKIAVASTDPNDPKVSVLKLPPMDNWIQPNFGPDPKHFTIVSLCTRDDCYEGAKGFNVWLATALPKDNLKRITPDAPDVRRAHPVFGATIDDLYWFVSDDRKFEGVHSDVFDRYFAHMADGRETIVFPALPADGTWMNKRGRNDPGELVIISAYGAGRYDEQGYYFTGEATGWGTSRAAIEAADKVGKYHSALFRHTAAGFELVEPVEVEYVDAPRGNRGYVAMAHHFTKEHNNAVADFRAVRDGQTLWTLRFHSQAYGVSASDDLATIVFGGERSYIDENHVWYPKLQDAVWLWRQGMAEPVDLNIPERVKATVEEEIQAERHSGLTGPDSSSSAHLAARTDTFVVQE